MKKIQKKRKVAKTQQLVIRVEQRPMVPTLTDLSEPMRDGKKLTAPKTWVSEGQLAKILQKTPPQYVYKRPGKGGGTFEYVTVSYIQKALNYIFGWNWDFEVVQQGMEGGQVWVLGKLTVRGTQPGQTIVKTQYGRADIKFKRGTKDMLDYGNDLKGASSDALKKCASLLGIASDIYGKADYKSETQVEPINPSPEIVPDDDVKNALTCEVGDEIITPQEAAFSQKMFGRNLCREHQKGAKRK